MQKAECFITADGKVHFTQDAARHYADVRYGEALTRLAHRCVQIDKYKDMLAFLDENEEAFAELRRLKADMTLENPDGEGEDD